MEEKIVSPQIKGLIISMIIIVIGIAGYYSNLVYSVWFNWAVNGVFIIAVIIACIHFANQKQGYVTFGNVFMHGFKISLVVALIMLVYSVLAFSVLFPDMKEKLLQMQVEQMEKAGIDEDKMEQAQKLFDKFFWVGVIGGAIIGNLVLGCIGSLLGGAFAKKNKVDPFNQMPR